MGPSYQCTPVMDIPELIAMSSVQLVCRLATDREGDAVSRVERLLRLTFKAFSVRMTVTAAKGRKWENFVSMKDRVYTKELVSNQSMTRQEKERGEGREVREESAVGTQVRKRPAGQSGTKGY